MNRDITAFNIKHYLPEPIDFPVEDLEEFVKSPELRRIIECDFYLCNLEAAIQKAFAFLEDKVGEIEAKGNQPGIWLVVTRESLKMKCAGAMLLITGESKHQDIDAALRILKFADITLRLLNY